MISSTVTLISGILFCKSNLRNSSCSWQDMCSGDIHTNGIQYSNYETGIKDFTI